MRDRAPEAPAKADDVLVRALSPAEASACIEPLSDVLIDCVEGGASVSFVAPLERDEARAFWRAVADGVAVNDRTLLVAQDRTTASIVGTVQVLFAWPPNQPHRADVAKMLVPRRARRRGIGARLMRAAEEHAIAAGRTLLVLDTFTGSDAERLYTKLGWTPAGVIPEYALGGDGRLGSTTIFYKHLSPSE